MVRPLQISPYAPRWVLKFDEERNRIQLALARLACRIDHNGSTSVPGLDAKPVIDIQISVEQLEPIRVYADPLATLDYVHVAHVVLGGGIINASARSWPRFCRRACDS